MDPAVLWAVSRCGDLGEAGKLALLARLGCGCHDANEKMLKMFNFVGNE